MSIYSIAGGPCRCTSSSIFTATAATAARQWSTSSGSMSGRDFELSARELPDYLPVLLEYLSCRDLAEARAMLADCAHILTTIGRSLIARGSRYAAVLQALIVIAGESPIDAAKVPPAKERTEFSIATGRKSLPSRGRQCRLAPPQEHPPSREEEEQCRPRPM